MNAKLVSLFVLLQFFVLLVNASIHCNDRGYCSGDGGPSGADVACGGCHSCTYKNCCHVRFTDPRTRCDIPGWRSNVYNIYHY